MVHLDRAGYKIMPWKNGLGQTAEIDRVPTGDGPYLWRLSQAVIQTDAPFSQFPGYDRWLCLCQGGAVFLNDIRLNELQPYRFSGEETVFCRLTGSSVADVGFIFDRAKVRATMSIVEGRLSLQRKSTHYLFDLKSCNTIKIEALELPVEMNVDKSVLISAYC
jgi:environmental stress-induced protein Ves